MFFLFKSAFESKEFVYQWKSWQHKYGVGNLSRPGYLILADPTDRQ